MARRELAWRGVGGAVVHARLHVVGAGLGNTSSSHVLITLVDSVLHLLQELINVDEIVLGANVGHRRQVVGRRLRATRAISTASTHGNTSGHGLVLRHGSIQNRELEGL
jgi:hypothetical protein